MSSSTTLDRSGLLVRLTDVTGSEENFLLPLVLSWWAQMNRQSSALAKHLCRSYEFDAELGDGSEKRMEGLMYNFEAVLRIALEGQVIELSKFYVCLARVQVDVSGGSAPDRWGPFGHVSEGLQRHRPCHRLAGEGRHCRVGAGD